MKYSGLRGPKTRIVGISVIYPFYSDTFLRFNSCFLFSQVSKTLFITRRSYSSLCLYRIIPALLCHVPVLDAEARPLTRGLLCTDDCPSAAGAGGARTPPRRRARLGRRRLGPRRPPRLRRHLRGAAPLQPALAHPGGLVGRGGRGGRGAPRLRARGCSLRSPRPGPHRAALAGSIREHTHETCSGLGLDLFHNFRLRAFSRFHQCFPCLLDHGIPIISRHVIEN